MIDAELLRRFFAPTLLRDRAMDLGRVLAARGPGRRTPLLVQFLVTLRCNLRCAYCENPEAAGDELDHDEVMAMLRELADAGMRKIAFGGGEPLLRKELGEWIRYARSRRAYVNVVTNGLLLPRRVDDLAEADLVVVSIDGPEEANDAVRGQGSYRKAVEGLRACRERGIKTMISAVLSSATVDHVDHILELARELDTTAIFQPVDPGYELARPSVADALPGEERLRAAFARLLEKKREGHKVGYPARFLRDPLPGGKAHRFPCRWAGRLFCSILPDGRVIPCNPLQTLKREWVSGAEAGYVEAMRRMPAFTCEGCGSGTPEIDSLLSFRFWDLV
jgi:MoaA/NifB/PqqE/SkfB family radical SAM enzyme